MTMNPVITPDVVNALCDDPMPVRRANAESQLRTETKKPSFWRKVGSFFKKTWAYCLAALSAIPPTINALARYKEACDRSQPKNGSETKRGRKKGRGV